MNAFVEAVATAHRSSVRSSPRESMESHLIAFTAEESRLSGQLVAVISG